MKGLRVADRFAITGPPSGKFAIELVSEVSAPLSAAKWYNDRSNNT